MKHTGIVSCYFKHNYGSMLQAYATQMVLDKMMFGNETINISKISKQLKLPRLKYFAKASLTSDFLIQKAGMASNLVRKKLFKNTYSKSTAVRDKKFEEFKDMYFRLSEPFETKEALTQKSKELYDNIVVGSDQLWLPVNIAADYYTLNFAPEDVNTIAYSTSFGMPKLTGDSLKKAKVFLKKIKHISVREESGKNIVYDAAGRNVPVVCDPTILFTGEEWLKIQQKSPIAEGKYIFCYFLGRNKYAREYAKKLRAATGCRIISLIHLDEYIKEDENYADETPFDIGPAEFVNLIRNAEYVCTDSFHCTVFSMLYNKSFFVFRRYIKETKQSTNGRLDNLLKIAGIDGRIQTGENTVEECLKKTIDYKAVHKNLEKIRKQSYEYLKTALENSESTDL